MEFVADVGAGFHDDGIRRCDLKFEEWRGEAFEIVSVGEEREDFVDGAGEEDGAVDGESFHVDGMFARVGCVRVRVIRLGIGKYT